MLAARAHKNPLDLRNTGGARSMRAVWKTPGHPPSNSADMGKTALPMCTVKNPSFPPLQLGGGENEKGKRIEVYGFPVLA